MATDWLALEGGSGVDLRRRVFVRGEERARLTSREVDLLRYLAERPGRVVGFDELHEQVWRYSPRVVSRAAYFTWRRLVHKVEADPSAPACLLTHHGEGVSYRPPGAPAAPRAAAPARPLLPLVGRAEERAAVARHLAAGVRLVTLTGPGGAGKTRLALALCEQGWRFADLTAATDADGVAAVVAAAVGLERADDLPAALRADPLVLVLDNCEQVAEAVAAAVGRWLVDAPALRIVATSRRPLRVPGEHLVEVAGLPLDDAVALFEARAVAAQHRFDPEASREHVRAIARALDGLPLALELAAARVRTLPVGQLRERLGEGLAVLGAAPAAPERHRTVEAAVAWSWSLLEDWQRRVLTELSVFAGGATEAAAAAVVTLPEGVGLLDALEALVDQSLVTVDLAGPEPRYAPFAVVAAYARARLDEDPVHAAAARTRHARWFAALAGEEWNTSPALVPELANLRLAAAHPDDAIAVPAGLRVVAALSDRGPLAEALATCETLALRATGAHAAWLESLRGRVLDRMGHAAATRALLPGLLARARALGLRRLEVVVRCNIAVGLLREGDLDGAERELGLALEDATARGDALQQGRALNLLGSAAARRGQWAEATERYRRGLAAAIAARDAFEADLIRAQLGRLRLSLGDPAAAEVVLRELHARQTGGHAVPLNLALALALQDRHEEALAVLDAAEPDLRRRGLRGYVLHALRLRAAIAWAREAWATLEAVAAAGRALAHELAEPQRTLLALSAVAEVAAGRTDGARRALAAFAAERPGAPTDELVAHTIAADAWARLGALAEADAALRAADAVAAQVGIPAGALTPGAARVRERVRAACAGLQQTAR